MADNLTSGDNDINQLFSRYYRLLNQQQNFAIEWQELADYILPRKNSILVNRIPGWKRTQRLFDSTAPDASDKLASSIHSTITPSFTKWFHLELEDEDLNSRIAIKMWLDMVTNKINAALNKSNFNSESHETYIDLVTFGTAALFLDENPKGGWWGGLRFDELAIGKYVVAEDAEGRVDTIFRTFPMTLHGIETKWPGKMPPEIMEKLKTKPDEEMEIVNCVYPSGVKNFQNYKWDSKYILVKTKTELSVKGYYEFPYLVPRWTKNADESYGRGPSHTALPDIRTLNKLTEMELRALAKVVDPPLGVVHGDIIGNARMIPGGITAVRSKDGIFPIETGFNYQVSNLKAETLKDSIRKMYYADQIQLATGGPQMTATEVNTRFDLMQRILGPALGRIEAEFTKPLLKRVFGLMYRAHLFDPIPQELMQKPVFMRIRYEGALARAQRSSDITALGQFNSICMPFFQAQPECIQVVDFDEAIRHVASVLDVPSRIIRDKDGVAKIRQAEQQEMQQQQAAQQAQQLAEGAKSAAPLLRVLGERPKPGSVMDKAS